MILYNTLKRAKEPFAPLDPENVRLYVCGPTVYNYIHVGNARPFVVFDTLYRVLKTRYPRVTYARNITDVDDKIIKAARDNGEPIEALTARFIQAFHTDMQALNTLAPDHEPHATAYIPSMVSMIQTLMDKGHAYGAQGHVLFDVTSMASYGALSKRQQEDLIAGARVEVAPYKKNPTDFVLWKPAPTDEPGWDSPWGRGRPGWHIECSAMATSLLGTTFDIHGGGLDLIFPHHENEIAQSACAHCVENPVGYWMHNGFITMSGEKMSKSLGNIFTLREALGHYPGEVIRLALLSTHYRQPMDWREDLLDQAKHTMDRLYTALRGVDFHPFLGQVATDPRLMGELCDDLNTPGALTVLHDLVHGVNTAQDKGIPAAVLYKSAQLLGLLYQDPNAWFQGDMDAATIETRIQERLTARKNKDYAQADAIRQDLLSQGIVLEDTPQGTTWKRH